MRAARLLLLGQLLSNTGDRVTQLALPFAVLGIGGSASDVGLVVGAGLVPFLLFSLAAGVVADRAGPRRTMLVSDLARLGIQATAGILLVAGVARVWELLALNAAFGTADAFFGPASVSLVPVVAGAAGAQRLNALLGLVRSVTSISGPALGGVLVAGTGPGEAILVDAGTFAVSAAALGAMGRTEAPRVARAAGARFLTDLKAGYDEVRARSWVVAFLAGMCVYHAVVLPSVFVLGPVIADRHYAGASSWALVVIGFGVGGVLGQLLLLRWRPRRALAVAAAALAGASAQAAIIGSGLPAWGIAALEVPAGVCVAFLFTCWEVSVQEHVPEGAVARVSSYDYLVSAGLLTLGCALAAPVAEAVGTRAVLFAMTAAGVAASAALLSVRSVRTLSRPVERGTAEPAPGFP